MRITVGHILVLAGIGAVAWGQISTHKFDSIDLRDKVSSVTSSVDSLMDLFKSGARPTPTLPAESKPEIEVAPVAEDKLPALETAEPPTADVPAETVPAAMAPPPAAAAAVKVPGPTKKVTKRRSKRASSRAAKDPLLGMEVSLTLSSGREVRGILEERSATSYKIQLPGMGPFTYDAANVKAIKAAK